MRHVSIVISLKFSGYSKYSKYTFLYPTVDQQIEEIVMKSQSNPEKPDLCTVTTTVDWQKLFFLEKEKNNLSLQNSHLPGMSIWSFHENF